MGIRKCTLDLPGNNYAHIHLGAATGEFMCRGQCRVNFLVWDPGRHQHPFLKVHASALLLSPWLQDGVSGNHPMARKRKKKFLAQKVLSSSTVCTQRFLLTGCLLRQSAASGIPYLKPEISLWWPSRNCTSPIKKARTWCPGSHCPSASRLLPHSWELICSKGYCIWSM